MKILTPQNFADYELLDSGNGERLERFGKFVLVRPDPQCIWKPHLENDHWVRANAIFERTSEDKGRWKLKTSIPEKWEMKYKDLSFYAKLTPFKHTGVFPEQSVQWDFISEQITNAKQEANVLNLFGYTGLATLAAAKSGAKVTHVDASRSTIGWARENQELSKLNEAPIRWILDDAVKFVSREIKRGVKYDGIIMDPPIFGHGPTGELWKFSESFPPLLELCKNVLSSNPLFIVINAYAISSSALMLENMLKDLKLSGTIEVGELALPEKDSDRLLSTGIFGRWRR